MSDDDTYEIPLQDQRIFGAGIKRKRVKFVPATTGSSNAAPPSNTPASSVSDLYLRLVLPGDTTAPQDAQSSAMQTSITTETSAQVLEAGQVCQICNLPLTSLQDTIPILEGEALTAFEAPKLRPHEASLAHQVCLTHSHPPSHLDRKRKGLAYLSSYGWDPDARLGLGASGQGIQYPITTKPKDDKLGIGVVLPKDVERMKKVKPVKLDAGKVRRMQEKDKKKAERLREMFYRNEDIERYLGGG
jgi:hypothetical protein